MKFTFNKAPEINYTFRRNTIFHYTFSSPKNVVYKIFFNKVALKLPIIEFDKYKCFKIETSIRHNINDNIDEHSNLSLIKVVQDFLNNDENKSSLLIRKDHLLSQDIFELKRKLDYKKLNEIWLSESSNEFFLVVEE